MTTPTTPSTISAGANAPTVAGVLTVRDAASCQQRVERQGHDTARLAAIADLIEPCPAPDVAHGYDLCAHAEAWPCPVTYAAWLARRLDPAIELAAELATARSLAGLDACTGHDNCKWCGVDDEDSASRRSEVTA